MPPGLRRTAIVGVALAMLILGACARPRAVVPPPPAPLAVGYEETGLASWYGLPYHGRRTASGEVYDMTQMTAAHRKLPFGTRLLVENLRNGRVAEVVVNDRGPFVAGRILDLSHAAAQVLDGVAAGVFPVRLQISGLTSDGVASAGRGGARAFTVQAGAFLDHDRATAVRRTLEASGIAARVQSAVVGTRTFYRVRLGQWPQRAEAEAQARRVDALGYPTLVLED
jgi:rare lipoprotein A